MDDPHAKYIAEIRPFTMIFMGLKDSVGRNEARTGRGVTYIRVNVLEKLELRGGIARARGGPTAREGVGRGQWDPRVPLQFTRGSSSKAFDSLTR